MSSPAILRLIKDEKESKSDSYKSYFNIKPKIIKSVTEDGNIEDIKDYMNWEGVLYGQKDTPYEDGVFNIMISMPDKYPLKPPIIKYLTKIYHPNIAVNGVICLDILKNHWSPALGITRALVSIISMMAQPNASDPLNTDAGDLYLKDKSRYEMMARTWTVEFALKTTSK